MKSRKSLVTKNHQGFTLVELMITLAMSAIIVSAIYSAYIIQQKTYYTQGQVVEMQQNIRAGLELMSSEIRMAGYGSAACAQIVTANGSRLQFRMDLNNDGDCADTNEDVTFGLAGVDGDSNGVVDDIDTNNDGMVDAIVTLTRTPAAGVAQAVSDGIQAIEFFYTLDNGARTLVPTAAQLDQIQTVQITMLAVANQRDPKYTNVDTYTTGSGAQWTPLLFSGAATGDNLRRRLLTSSVNVRNQGLN
jgi:type IV pilus assembly protein PilW